MTTKCVICDAECNSSEYFCLNSTSDDYQICMECSNIKRALIKSGNGDRTAYLAAKRYFLEKMANESLDPKVVSYINKLIHICDSAGPGVYLNEKAVDKKIVIEDEIEERNARPNTLSDCIKQDTIVSSLRKWIRSIDILGAIAFWMIILIGVIKALNTPDTSNTSAAIAFDILLLYALYALIEYIIYRTLSMLIKAQAGIYINTRQSAKLLEYQLRKAESTESTDQS